jgi:hypothetical protein
MSVAEAWGLRCPQCGDDENLNIQCSVWVKLFEDGTETDGDHDWDSNSPASCSCGWEGRVRDANIEEVKP